MHLNVKEDAQASLYLVIDKDTEEVIEDCYEADDETGEYFVYAKDDKGGLLMSENKDVIITKKKQGNIKFIKKGG